MPPSLAPLVSPALVAVEAAALVTLLSCAPGAARPEEVGDGGETLEDEREAGGTEDEREEEEDDDDDEYEEDDGDGGERLFVGVADWSPPSPFSDMMGLRLLSWRWPLAESRRREARKACPRLLPGGVEKVTDGNALRLLSWGLERLWWLGRWSLSL